MNVPQIQIQTTRAVLGLQITKPTQEIEQPSATLTQEQPAAILEMSTTKPQLSIDTTEARADLDLKSSSRRIAENAQYGEQSVQEGIGRRAQEGQQLAAIENGGNAIVEIIKQNTTPTPKQLGIRFVGNSMKIQTSFQPGSLDIKVTPQKAINNVQINKPIHHYNQGKVTGEMEQWNSIQIDFKY
ncbi:DUF6470 family protein [Sporosarcina sp. FA9]|uniref:DUF6470 family protein n=1 Tax=Sporosarcina sp. FA9 TaxID=3413030 RepID=UPI003F65A758